MTPLQRITSLLGVAISLVVIQGVLPNILAGLIQTYYLIGGTAILAVFVLFLFLRYWERTATRKARESLDLIQRGNPSPRKGLIVLASPGPRTTAAENAVKAHLASLEHCWIIVGPDRPDQAPSSRQNAEAIIQRYGAIKSPPIGFYIKAVDDEDDPRKVYHLVTAVYEEAKAYGLAEKDVIADYTGGTKSMTAGVVLACSTSEHRDTQYMKAKQVTPMGTAEPRSEATPVLVDLGFGAGE